MSQRPSAGQFLDDLVPERPEPTTATPAPELPADDDEASPPSTRRVSKKSAGAKSKRRERPGGTPAPAAKKPATTNKLTITVPIEFAEELRNAVVWLQQNGRRETLTSLVVDSTRTRLQELKDDIGGPIPERDEQWSRLVPGAPPGGPAPE